MRIYKLLFSFLLFTPSWCLAVNDSVPVQGTEHVSSSFFRQRYLHNDLIHYLDNLNDNITYQSETTGGFNMPEQWVFSVAGNSYKWNRYYVDNFRTDSRFATGSTAFRPDMWIYSLSINRYNSELHFSADSAVTPSVAARYTAGGFLGGRNMSSEKLVEMFHPAVSDRLLRDIDERNNIKGMGQLYLNYLLRGNGKTYNQHVYADFGTRKLVDYDQTGISNYYPESFFNIQLNGQLPIASGKLFDKTSYLIQLSQRDNLYNELNYTRNETARLHTYGLSVYGSKNRAGYSLTSGFSLNTNVVRHNDLNFARNIIDQDGEAFEPWYPDGNTSELSHSISFKKRLTPFAELAFEGFNSLISFSAVNTTFQNAVYANQLLAADGTSYFTPLYVYQWTSSGFASGLLENSLSISSARKLSRALGYSLSAGLSFDAMLLSKKSMARPNWQFQAGVSYRPSHWFDMEVNASRQRVSFNMEDIRYFSNDYLNGDIYFWKDTNGDHIFQTGEKSDYFRSTGGKYHTPAPDLPQEAYFVLDIPLHFRFGHHEIGLINTYKKYFNSRITRFDKDATEYGYYKTVNDKQVFFYNSGTIQYVVDTYPEEYMKTDTRYNFLTNTPFYVSNTFSYKYENHKLLLSLSWTSFMMTGVSGLGNGVLSNNLSAYSESTANPNVNYKLVGRLDADRAYVARILASYMLNEHWTFTLNGKFKDGQPFTSYLTGAETDAKGNTQMAVWNYRTKGINPFDNDFGSRDDAFFNIDVRAAYRGTLHSHRYELQLAIYNLYDFGTSLGEYAFPPVNAPGRYVLSIDIPRGLMISAKVDL